jgi:hypothetical protein
VIKKLMALTCLIIVVWLFINYEQIETNDEAGTTTEQRIVVPIHTHQETASERVVRISQLDPAQYASQSEYTQWWASACSAASMTVVLNSYGAHYRITDILAVESALREITPDAGLLEPEGIAHTVEHTPFDMQAQTYLHMSLQTLLTISATRPVIVNFPPDLWAGGHFLVVHGSGMYWNDQYVNPQTGKIERKFERHLILADSSRLDMAYMPVENFLKYWVGLAIIISPKGIA